MCTTFPISQLYEGIPLVRYDPLPMYFRPRGGENGELKQLCEKECLCWNLYYDIQSLIVNMVLTGWSLLIYGQTWKDSNPDVVRMAIVAMNPHLEVAKQVHRARNQANKEALSHQSYVRSCYYWYKRKWNKMALTCSRVEYLHVLREFKSPSRQSKLNTTKG